MRRQVSRPCPRLQLLPERPRLVRRATEPVQPDDVEPSPLHLVHTSLHQQRDGQAGALPRHHRLQVRSEQRLRPRRRQSLEAPLRLRVPQTDVQTAVRLHLERQLMCVRLSEQRSDTQ